MNNTTRRNILLLAVFSFLITSCKERPHKRVNNDFIIDSLKVDVIKQAETISDIFEKKSIVRLETNDSCRIGRIGEIIEVKSKNRLIILDYRNSEAYLFNSNGKFINKIGKKGKGPGEFNRLYSACYDNNKIYVATNYRLLVFDIYGNYLKYYYLRKNKGIFYVHKIYVIDDILVTYQRYPSSINADVIVFSLKEDRILNEYGQGENNYGYLVSLFTKLNNNCFLFGSSFNEDLFQIELDNNDVKVFAILENVTKLPEEFTNITGQNQQVIWKQKNRDISNSFEPFYDMKTVQDFIFVGQVIIFKGKKYSIYDANGNLLKILNDFNFLNTYKELNFRDELRYKLFNNGLIVYGYEKEKSIGANPTLVFYKLKDKINNFHSKY